MTLAGLLSQDVDLLAYDGTATDAWGNETPSYVVDANGPYRGRVEHTDSQEIAYAGETVVTDWQVFLDASAPITAQHRVREGGRTFRVIGEPASQRSPRGVHHITARLVAVGE